MEEDDQEGEGGPEEGGQSAEGVAVFVQSDDVLWGGKRSSKHINHSSSRVRRAERKQGSLPARVPALRDPVGATAANRKSKYKHR